MARTSTPLELVSVYKLMAFPSCVPKDCFCTPDFCWAGAACARNSPAIATTGRTRRYTVLRRLGIMAKVYYGKAGLCAGMAAIRGDTIACVMNKLVSVSICSVALGLTSALVAQVPSAPTHPVVLHAAHLLDIKN